MPTIVVVSACCSGSFATGKMAKPNRIVLTAARNDRPSFGCQVRRIYNFFDECPRRIAKICDVAGCGRGVQSVRTPDGARAWERPSEPQAYFGALVANLDVGF